MSCWHVARNSSTGYSRKVQNLSPLTCTDFSIDSILSNDKNSNREQRDEKTESANCETNSKLTDQSKISKRKRKLSRNPRVPFTSLQLAILETHYKMTAYISGIDVTYLSVYLDLSPNKIKVWFQNRRARERRIRKKMSDNDIPCVQFSSEVMMHNDQPSSDFVTSSEYFASH